MTQQANGFLEASNALFALLEPVAEADFSRPTQFKGWTIDDVLGHLHMWNVGADLSLSDADEFMRFVQRYRETLAGGESRQDYTRRWLEGRAGSELLQLWHRYCAGMAERFNASDPKARVKWVGPDMSVRSSITARQMETWAHGQEAFDLLGAERSDTDSIKNIAVLGVNTFGWTFANRKLPAPSPVPHVRLTAPSGAVWEWNTPDEANRIEGSAVEFCQVVTQVRNIGDTRLKVSGQSAERWMSIAQCFAGEPNDPPPTGSRFRK